MSKDLLVSASKSGRDLLRFFIPKREEMPVAIIVNIITSSLRKVFILLFIY